MRIQKEKRPAASDGKKANLSGGLKKLLILAAVSILSCAVYFTVIGVAGPEVQMAMIIIFLVLSCGLAVFYFIYNRGLVLSGATPDMLSGEKSYEEREAEIAEAAERRRKTRWIAVAVFALILPVLLDAFYLFVLEDVLPSGIKSWLS